MRAYLVKTLGCKANFSDTHWIQSQLEQQGWVQAESEKSSIQLCIVNSCAVTESAQRQTCQIASKLAKKNPQALVLVTGCAAEIDSQAILAATGVHVVVGNQDKHRLVQTLIDSHILEQTSFSKQILGNVQSYQDFASAHPADRSWPPAHQSFGDSLNPQHQRTRVFLKVQEGCNSFCTYCIIPYGRGPSRSLSPKEIIEQINQFIQNEINEIVLTATNLGDYAFEKKILEDLIEAILEQTALKRLRLSSLAPHEVTPRLQYLLKQYSPRLCPHLHIALQSPVDRILKLMKRKDRSLDIQNCFHFLRQFNQSELPLFIGIDLITGFPGETTQDFEEGFALLHSLEWHRLHVFPYSERKHTPATRLPQVVPLSVRHARAKQLIQLSMQRLTNYYQCILNKKIPLHHVLIEKNSAHSTWFTGYTPNYLKILIPNKKDNAIKTNTLLSVKPTDLIIDRVNCDVAFIAEPA